MYSAPLRVALVRPRMAAAAAPVAGHALEAFVQRIGWYGNQRLFANKVALALEQKVPGFATINNGTSHAAARAR